MLEQIELLKDYIVTYRGENYYLVSDIFAITAIQKSYLYLLIKKRKIKALDKEGIKFIAVDSFNDYLLNRGAKEGINKTDLLKQIKNLPDDELKRLKDFLNGK